MGSFFKENIVLISGILLPLILTLVFFVSIQINSHPQEIPQHKVIYATGYYPNNATYGHLITVQNDKVLFKYTPPEKPQHHNRRMPKLFIFDPAKNETIEILLPDILDRKKEFSVVPDGLEKITVHRHSKSPDGFIFFREHRNGGNLMTEMFGGGYRSRSRYVLKKEHHKFPVKDLNTYNAHFVAWIIDEEKN